MCRVFSIAVCLLLMPLGTTTSGAPPAFEKEIRPVLARFCVRCHGAETEEGNVRLDNLNGDLVNGPDAERWHAALDMINQGDMPPEDEPQLPRQTLDRVTTWIQTELQRAAEARRATNRRVLRRLTREQYTNTLQALLHVDVNFGNS